MQIFLPGWIIRPFIMMIQYHRQLIAWTTTHMVLSLGILIMLNLIDFAATWLWVDIGLTHESNPLMAAAIEQGGVVKFFLCKLGLICLVCILLYRMKPRYPDSAALLTLSGQGIFTTLCGIHAYIGVILLYVRMMN